MSLFISIRKVKEMLVEMNFPLYIKAELKRTGFKKHKLSAQLGRDGSYLQRQLKNPDQPASLLLLLSQHLNTNLFEPFINLLPDHIRPTRKEKQLQQQIEDLQKQVADIAKERDLLKEIVMK
ncbi:MAG TPA: hypothetical protein PL045_02890 [Chitinophagaceae bacterium]|nr:hypothetical protein [Chitinophagaceae bacterium]